MKVVSYIRVSREEQVDGVIEELNNLMLANGITLDRAALSAAQGGEAVILDTLISGEKGVPHAAAYVPILAGTETPPVAVMILVELEEIYSFQNSILNNTVFIFTALTLLAVSIIYFAIYRTTIRPLNELKAIAQTMTSGQYDERAPVTSQDEVGQLAVAFNEMATWGPSTIPWMAVIHVLPEGASPEHPAAPESRSPRVHQPWSRRVLGRRTSGVHCMSFVWSGVPTSGRSESPKSCITRLPSWPKRVAISPSLSPMVTDWVTRRWSSVPISPPVSSIATS